MKTTTFTCLILELNSSMDSGTYDDIPMQEAIEHIEAGDVVPWLQRRAPNMDLSLLTESDIAEYQESLV
jgi:hypothetical protein